MNGDYVVKEVKIRDLTVKVIIDDNPENPREWDNLGFMACWHSRYNLGDENNLSKELFLDTLKTFKGVVLPLYLYDHSGITMSTSPFSCQWDSGQVGFIYVDDNKIKKEYNVKRISKKLREQVKQILIGEVETYDAYLTGQVYGYSVKETGDCCYGFYNMGDALREGVSSAESYIHKSIKHQQRN